MQIKLLLCFIVLCKDMEYSPSYLRDKRTICINYTIRDLYQINCIAAAPIAAPIWPPFAAPITQLFLELYKTVSFNLFRVITAMEESRSYIVKKLKHCYTSETLLHS